MKQWKLKSLGQFCALSIKIVKQYLFSSFNIFSIAAENSFNIYYINAYIYNSYITNLGI